MHLPKAVFVLALFSVFGAETIGASGEVHAAGRCFPVIAVVETSITTENCTSPIGLCTAGHLVGGPFDGATTFLTLDAAPSAGMPGVEPAANLSYSGTFTLTQPGGTYVSSDLGVLDASHATFVEMMRSESGTGRFQNPSGVLSITGTLVNNETGFSGLVTGELCTDSGN